MASSFRRGQEEGVGRCQPLRAERAAGARCQHEAQRSRVLAVRREVEEELEVNQGQEAVVGVPPVAL